MLGRNSTEPPYGYVNSDLLPLQRAHKIGAEDHPQTRAVCGFQPLPRWITVGILTKTRQSQTELVRTAEAGIGPRVKIRNPHNAGMDQPGPLATPQATLAAEPCRIATPLESCPASCLAHSIFHTGLEGTTPLLSDHLSIRRGEADHENCRLRAGVPRVVCRPSRDRNRVASLHRQRGVTEPVVDRALDYVQHLVTVGVSMRGILLARIDRAAPNRHRVGVTDRTRDHPLKLSPRLRIDDDLLSRGESSSSHLLSSLVTNIQSFASLDGTRPAIHSVGWRTFTKPADGLPTLGEPTVLPSTGTAERFAR